MARVVQPRKSPPYVAIIFVFLFLIAGSLAVVFHMQKTETEKAAADAKAELKVYAQEAERRNAKIAAMEKAFEENSGRPGAINQTVTAQLVQQVRDLTQWITGVPGDFEQAKTAVDKVTNEVLGGSFSGFVNELKRLKSLKEAEQQKVVAAKARNETLSKELEEKSATIRQNETKFTQDMEAANATIAKLQNDKKTQHDEYLKKLADAEAISKKDIADLNDTITKLNAELEKRQIEINKQAQKVAQLESTIRDLRGPGPQDVRPQADGKVIRIVDGTDRCYINIGAQNNVKVGMTFSVWPATGIPAFKKGEEEKPKATLVVTNVGQTVSECKITEQDKKDPIIEKDLVSNIAFDENRVYTFVVEGKFDLLGKGKPTEAGAEAVKQLIRRVGGKVASEVNIDTDFVVIGEEPVPPPKPADDAPPQVWKVYQEQMKTYQDYKNIQSLATSMRIPILNANRFLALMGLQMASARTQ